MHGGGWRRPFLQRIRSVHNALLFGYPILILAGLGLTGPRLLWMQNWSHVPIWGWAALALGAIGLGFLVASTVRHWRYRPPACEVLVRSQVLDIRSQTAAPLIGEGRAKWLARLPFNQQFTLEVQEKTYLQPQLPAAWDGLSIVHFSDTHFRGPVTRAYFEQAMAAVQEQQGDIIAFTGDLLDRRDCLEWVPETLGKLSAPLGCYFVLGNHDWYLGNEAAIRETLTQAGWKDLAGRVVELRRGADVLTLCGNERPWMGTLPDLSSVPADAYRILLSHGPDQIRWAQRNGMHLMLAGHTHGGQIQLPVLGPVYSPSLYSCRYASGVFWEPPTLMSVTRGISGREPIRYNCRPEVTRLVLRRS